MNQLDYSGIWWLPSHPENQISGRLKFDPVKEISLDLIGSFHELKYLGNIREEEIILGLTSNGKLVTLYKCFETSKSISFPGFAHSAYHAQFVFVGHHFNKSEEFLFESMSINYYFLEKWVGITGFQTRFETNDAGHLLKEVISYVFPKDLIVAFDDLNIALTFHYNSGGDRIGDVILKQTTFFKITREGGIDFDFFMSKVNYLLQNLITFGLGRATRASQILLNAKDATDDHPDGTTSRRDIELYYQVNELPDLSRDEHPFKSLFFLSDISSTFDVCLKNWFSKEVMLRPVLDLYFATLNTSSMYLNHEFLNISQALESYHRQAIGGEYVPVELFDKIYATVVGSIPPFTPSDLRMSLEQRMKYGNEFSLRKRLNGIFKKLGALVDPYIKDKDAFIEQVVTTRNYFTHYDKKESKKVARNEKLYWITRKLRAIIEICLLLELGLSPEIISNLLKRNQEYRFLSGK